MLITRVVDELGSRFDRMEKEALKPERDLAALEALKGEFIGALTFWDRHLETRPQVAGDTFSLADIVLYTLFPMLRHAAQLEVPEQLPNLRGWLERMAARPGGAVPVRPRH